MADDVVAELDRWLSLPASLREATVSHALLQGARDEIVALRGFRAECERQFQAQVAEVGRLLDHVTCPQVRAEALEEAAQACVGSGAIVAEARLCASAIRALKEKGS